MKRRPLDRLDWDFSSCPQGAEIHCMLYEFARETERLRDDYAYHLAHRSDPKQAEFLFPFRDETCVMPLWNPPELCDPLHLDFVEIPAGFPSRPFLSLGYTPRRAYGPKPYFPALQEVHPGQIVGKERVSEPEETEIDLGDGESMTAVKLGFPHWRVAFLIDYSFTDKAIISAFERWLKMQKRPSKPFDLKGVSPAREAMAHLCALGAYRLMKHFNVPSAIDYSGKFRAPLYRKESDWFEARKRIESFLWKFEKDDWRF